MRRLFAPVMSLALVATLAVPAVAYGPYTLYAAKDTPVGTVTINEYVVINLNPGWCMTEAHVHSASSMEGIPQANGNPRPGLFEVSATYDPCAGGASFTLDPGPYYAVHAVVSRATGWADKVVDSNQGKLANGNPVLAGRSNPNEALVKDYTGSGPTTFFSLGFKGAEPPGGDITVKFDCKVAPGAGDDLKIWEATNGDYPLEKALVEVSKDGSTWTAVGTANNASGTGPNRGSSFDVGQWFKFVKLTEMSNKGLFESTADGFDVDGIKALQRCKAETAWAANNGVGTIGFPGANWATYINIES